MGFEGALTGATVTLPPPCKSLTALHVVHWSTSAFERGKKIRDSAANKIDGNGRLIPTSVQCHLDAFLHGPGHQIRDASLRLVWADSLDPDEAQNCE